MLLGLRGLEPFYDLQEERDLRRFRAQSLLLMIAGSLFCAIAARRDEPQEWTREAAKRAAGVVFAGVTFMMLLVRVL